MTKSRVGGTAGLLLIGLTLLGGCGDRKSGEGESQRPPDQPQSAAPSVVGQSGSQESPSAAEQARPEEEKEDNSAIEKRPKERG